MSARDDAIEAGAAVLVGGTNYIMSGDAGVAGTMNRLTAAAVVDAVEPIIRADERARLLAKVEVLIDGHCFYFTEWATGVPKCRHWDHRSGWSAPCPQAWAAEHVAPLLGGESE